MTSATGRRFCRPASSRGSPSRILLTKPRAVFLDESTSALDEGLKLTLYELIRAELPDMILVSVSHRSTVEQFHGRQLELVGGGDWRLEPLTAIS